MLLASKPLDSYPKGIGQGPDPIYLVALTAKEVISSPEAAVEAGGCLRKENHLLQ